MMPFRQVHDLLSNDGVVTTTRHPLFLTNKFIVLHTDAEGKIKDLNPYAQTLLKYGTGDLSGGISFLELLDGEVFRTLHRTKPETFLEWVMLTHLPQVDFETWKLRSKDGIEFIFDFSVIAIEADNPMSDYFLIGKEVSRYVRFEQEIQEIEHKLQAKSVAFKQLAESEILQSGDFNIIASVLLEIFAITIEVDRTSLWLFNAEGTALTCAGLYERRQDAYLSLPDLSRSKYPVFFELIQQNEVITIYDVNQNSRLAELQYEFFQPQNISAIMIVPIRQQNAVIGYLVASHTHSVRKWDLSDQNFGLAIANYIAIGFESHRHRELSNKLYQKEQEINRLKAELESLQHNAGDTLAKPTAESHPVMDAEAQNKLIHTEKMATLGTLIAGVAHEINTPIGAISAAGTNLSRSLQQLLQKMPAFFQNMTPDLEELFFKMVDRSLNTTGTLSSREERQYKKEVAEILGNYSIPNASNLAKELVKIGIYNNLEEFLPIFTLPNSEEFIEMAYGIGRLRVNIDNIGTAVAKTQKIVFALKSYSRRNSFDETEQASITQSIETVITIYHNQIKYGIELTTDFDRNIPLIRCYPDELIQVWTNIIHNAIQAMEGKGKLHIEAKQQNDNIVVKITDSGPGIPQHVLARIFEPFFTTKPEGEGSGLGLDICNKIIAKHYGKIEVDTEPGRTTFIVTLPIHSPLTDQKNNVETTQQNA
jgi:signal transduction histidine kinase